MEKIIFTEPGQMNPKEKEKLEALGITVIEVKDPTKIKTIVDVEPVNGNDIFMSAMEAVKESVGGDRHFVAELVKRLKDKEVKK